MIIAYLSLPQVVALHAAQLVEFGGASGVRDRGGLESARARPAMTFGGEDLYPDIPTKAAALMHSLALNHPFLDGNKRVAAAAAIVFAELNGNEFLGDEDGLVEITLDVAQGQVEVEALAIWFRQRLRPVE